MKLIDISVFASGGGGNFSYLIDNQKDHNIKIKTLVVDKKCGAISIAKKHNIETILLNNDYIGLFDNESFSSSQIFVLAGFMPIVPKVFLDLLSKRKKKLINTHPSLLPKHGGKGMYGVHVQESVLKSKDKIAGCTAHLVNEEIDAGDIICQSSIKVEDGISAWDLGGKIFALEGPNLIKAIRIADEKF